MYVEMYAKKWQKRVRINLVTELDIPKETAVEIKNNLDIGQDLYLSHPTDHTFTEFYFYTTRNPYQSAESILQAVKPTLERIKLAIDVVRHSYPEWSFRNAGKGMMEV